MEETYENKKYRHAYNATIYDYKRTYYSKSVSGKRNYFLDRSNRREKIFCICGNSIEFQEYKWVRNYDENYKPNFSDNPFATTHLILEASTNKYYSLSTTHFEPIVCYKCNKQYSSTKDTIELSSYKKSSERISFVKFKVFENENNISLYNYTNILLISSTTGKLIGKDTFNSLCFNKNKKCFYLKFGKKVQRIGLRRMSDYLGAFMFFSVRKVFCNYFSREECEKHIFADIDIFFNKISTFINNKDLEKINNTHKQKLDDNLILKENVQDKDWNADYSSLEEARFSIEFKLLYDKVTSAMAFIMYPAMSTIAFTKSLEFVNKLINNTYAPPLYKLKQSNPTTPSKIIEESIKIKILHDTKMRIRERNRKKPLEQPSSSNYDFSTYDASADMNLNFLKITKKTYKELDCDNINEFYSAVMHYPSSPILDKNLMSALLDKYGVNAFSQCFSSDSIYRDIVNKNHILHILTLSKKHVKETQRNISVYVDTIRLFSALNMPENDIFNYNNFYEINEIHNELTVKIETIKVSEFDVLIKEKMQKYKHYESTIDNIHFEIIDTASELVRESGEMSHCVGSYYRQVADGRYIIFRITGQKEDRATMSVRISGYSMFFDQLKSKHNKKASNRVITACLQILKNIKVSPLQPYAENRDLTLL